MFHGISGNGSSLRGHVGRGVSLLTAFIMAAQLPAAALPVYANEVTEEVSEEITEEITDEITDDIAANPAEENVDEIASNPAESNEPGEVPSVSQNDASEYGRSLRYIYMEETQLAGGETSHLLISLDDERTFEGASLELIGRESGEVFVAEGTAAGEGELLFEIPALKEGTYGLGILSVALAKGTVETLNIADIEGLNEAAFGVGLAPALDEPKIMPLTDESNDPLSAESASDSGGDASGVVSVDVKNTDMGAVARQISEALTQQATLSRTEADELSAEGAVGKVVVVLDPGHDDSHAGARSHGLVEERMTLTVANYCKKYLEDNYSNVTVYMTRTSTACPYPGTTSVQDNASRVDAASRVSANAYVSIHFNTTGAASTATAGAMVFYPNGNYNASASSGGLTLAKEILQRLVALGLRNNGVRIYNSQSGDTYPDGSLADYYGVIRRSKLYGFPGIIVEHAFLNNDSDAAFCASDDNLKKLGEADAKGIAAALSLKNGPSAEAENGKVVNKTGYKLTAKLNAKETKVSLSLTGADSKAKKVYFNVYSEEEEMDDLATYYAEEDEDEDGTWLAECKIEDHETAGAYKVFAYTVNSSGAATKVASGDFMVKGPTTGSVKIKSVNLGKGTFQIRAYDVAAPSGIKQVQIQATNQSGKKEAELLTAKKKSNYYYVTVKLSNHGYNTGKYKAQVIVTDKTGIKKTTLNKKIDMGVPSPTVTAKLQSKQTKLALKVTNAGVANQVEGVKFKVKCLTNKKTKTYKGKKGSSGAYSVNVKVSDFATAGTYQITCYRKLKSGSSYVKIGTTKKVTVGDITGGVATAVASGTKGNTLKISGFKVQSDITKMSVKVWPKVNKACAYTYQAEDEDGIYSAEIDYKNHKKKTGTYKYEITVKLKNGITKLALKGAFELGKDPELYVIEGVSGVTLDQLVDYYQAHATYPAYYSGTDASSLRKFCKLYIDECAAEGIKAEVAFCQAMKETNFLRFGGDVKITQHNFAGLGATGGGAQGTSFDKVQTGIRAQIQHLKAYASDRELINTCVDTRFSYVTRKSAPYVEWLGIQENPARKGWATDPGYGQSIIYMITELKGY